MITKCPRWVLVNLQVMDPETGEEIVHNPPGFDYYGELEAIADEASQLADACTDAETRQEMKNRWGCHTVKELDHQYTSQFKLIAADAVLHQGFQPGTTASADNQDYTVNNEVPVLKRALAIVRDTPLSKRTWP